MSPNIIAFGFKGLPLVHISENYKGTEQSSLRSKVKKSFLKYGNVRNLYINLDTGNGHVFIDISSSTSEEKSSIYKLRDTIFDSPMGMIKISWEQPLHNMKSDFERFLPYKSWLFNHHDGTYAEIKARHDEKLKIDQTIDMLQYQNYLQEVEFEGEQEQWGLQCGIDEILTSCSPEYLEYENTIIENRKRKYDEALIIPYEDFESSDDEDFEDYELVESFSPVSGKTNFSIEEVSEHIRMLGVTTGKTELSIKELTHYFGQKREYKKIIKQKNVLSSTDLEVEFPKLSL